MGIDRIGFISRGSFKDQSGSNSLTSLFISWGLIGITVQTLFSYFSKRTVSTSLIDRTVFPVLIRRTSTVS